MRYTGPFRCEKGHFESPVAVSCSLCGDRLLDVDGNLPPRPRRQPEGYFFRGIGKKIGLVVSLVLGTLGSLFLLALVYQGPDAVVTVDAEAAGLGLLGILLTTMLFVLGAIAIHKKDKQGWFGREALRLSNAAADATAVDAISQAKEGPSVRFKGRVRALDSGVLAQHTRLDERTGGRFLIEDESGAALFDDDCFELWNENREPVSLELSDGDEVEVVAQGQWKSSKGLTAGSYRNDGQVFALEGTPDRPIHLRRTQVSAGKRASPQVRVEDFEGSSWNELESELEAPEPIGGSEAQTRSSES